MNLKYVLLVLCLRLRAVYSGGHHHEKKHEHIKIHVPEIHEHKYHTKYIVIHHHPAKKHHHTHHKPKIPHLHKQNWFHHQHHKKEDKHHTSHHESQDHHGDYGHHHKDHHSYHKSNDHGSHGQNVGYDGYSHEPEQHYSYSPEPPPPVPSHDYHEAPQEEYDYSYKPHSPKVNELNFEYKKVNLYETPGYVPTSQSHKGSGYKVTEDEGDSHHRGSFSPSTHSSYSPGPQHSYSPELSEHDSYSPSYSPSYSYDKHNFGNQQHGKLSALLQTQPIVPMSHFPTNAKPSSDTEFEYTEEISPAGQYGQAFQYGPQGASSSGTGSSGLEEVDDLLKGYSAGDSSDGLTEALDDNGDIGRITKVGGYQNIIQTGGHQITEY